MYYLLHNNIIIKKDDERLKNLTYSIDKTKTYIYLECDGETPNAIFDCQKYYYSTKHLVLKESDNVLDLIERETDLLKIKVLGFPNIMEARSIKGSFDGMNNIIAIYKPNSKGDYIKVWEKDSE